MWMSQIGKSPGTEMRLGVSKGRVQTFFSRTGKRSELIVVWLHNSDYTKNHWTAHTGRWISLSKAVDLKKCPCLSPTHIQLNQNFRRWSLASGILFVFPVKLLTGSHSESDWFRLPSKPSLSASVPWISLPGVLCLSQRARWFKSTGAEPGVTPHTL